ncbi:hypothetical protein CC1G_06002 [Coprinopsis cinerea okayama7|uniref:Uncharacterized protein n=1 Tax=Coprinopsis cinerea (strain Okayama-7 / 130 / ATCC MYA-4618 / FGSC 9003) TaxID=240176 RepID=A8N4M4_COPC7|nr:hypothetical protein CC1G_06002 [Coprinopsis cinerea okayama7\|eukprot:XP_001829793.1 hypothetical protein CC1G_06002 [Coprinopsis cinerea okayama7\
MPGLNKSPGQAGGSGKGKGKGKALGLDLVLNGRNGDSSSDHAPEPSASASSSTSQAPDLPSTSSSALPTDGNPNPDLTLGSAADQGQTVLVSSDTHGQGLTPLSARFLSDGETESHGQSSQQSANETTMPCPGAPLLLPRDLPVCCARHALGTSPDER